MCVWGGGRLLQHDSCEFSVAPARKFIYPSIASNAFSISKYTPPPQKKKISLTTPTGAGGPFYTLEIAMVTHSRRFGRHRKFCIVFGKDSVAIDVGCQGLTAYNVSRIILRSLANAADWLLLETFLNWCPNQSLGRGHNGPDL